MLYEADLRILDSLHSPKSITELITAIDYSSGYISERVAHLENYDLVVTTRQHHDKQVRVLRTSVLETYRDLTASNSHIDFPSLVSPSMLRVCWFIDTPTAVSDIEPRLNVRRRRIYQLLETLQSRGLITKHGNRYALPDDHTELAEFAHVVIKYEHQYRAQSLLKMATVVWSAPHEALITISGDTDVETVVETFENWDNWWQTGLSRFDEYGLEFFITGAPPYFYSELRDNLVSEDFIAHTLLLKADARNLSYCALLMLATDVSTDKLRTTASRYGVDDTIDALISFVETSGEIEQADIRLPQWSEMKLLATQYGVTI